MINLKNLIVAAIAGFTLSFLISIISTHNLFVALLRGIIFAVVFAILAFAIDFVNKRFLSVGESLEIKTENQKAETQKAGSVVNITIDDENLTDEEDAPNFDISANRGYFSNIPKSVENQVFEEPNEQTENQVVQQSDSSDAETSDGDDVHSTESENKSSATEKIVSDKKTAITAEHLAQVQEIDALPDILEFTEDSSGTAENSVVTDSDFVQAGSQTSSFATETPATEHDTKTIASAIRTLLKKDEM